MVQCRRRLPPICAFSATARAVRFRSLQITYYNRPYQSVMSMISPTESLAFSMHANPGVYAILAGAGVSLAAKIPTGWDITLDLVRKLAALRGETCDPDPEQWYRSTFGKEADYSDLLDALCGTPAERQQLLRDYIEPSAADRDEGTKRPTTAHRSIAALAAKGFIRVILTTNFDRLIETALDDAGVKPAVMTTPDQLQGALPLIHTPCCVVKLHGDYLDTRIRNTQAELDRYPEDFDRLLDRIFDDFGLVVCGWSATWDGALRKALYRASSRRFTTYWALHGKVGDDARGLIEHRAAELIPIKDADEFFGTVQQQVESLQEFARPHPLSTEAAVASLKRYLSEARHRIRLSDLVDGVVEHVIEATSGEAFGTEGPRPDTVSATARVRRYEAACSTLLALATVGGFWAEDEHVLLWQRAVSRLGSTRSISGYGIWVDLGRYPGSLLLPDETGYALGIGAVEAGRLGLLGRLLETPIREEHREDETAIQVLPPGCLFDGNGHVMRMLEGMERRHAPLNDWMHTALRPPAGRIIPKDSRYTFVFDKLEILIALNYIHGHSRDSLDIWLPLGAFGYRRETRGRIVQEIEESLSSRRNDSPFVKCGIFGDTEEVCRQRLATLKDVIAETRWR